MPTGLGLGLFASLAWGMVDVAAAISTRFVGSLRVLVGTQLVSVVVLVALGPAVPVAAGLDGRSKGRVAGFPLGILAAGGVPRVLHGAAPRAGLDRQPRDHGVRRRDGRPGGAAARGGALVAAGAGRRRSRRPGSCWPASRSRRDRCARCASSGRGSWRRSLTLIGFAVVTLLLATPIRDHGWLPVVIGSRIGNNVASIALLRGALRLVGDRVPAAARAVARVDAAGRPRRDRGRRVRHRGVRGLRDRAAGWRPCG